MSERLDSLAGSESPSGLVEHFFRHEYGRLVAQLVRKIGLRHLEIVEDAVQAALASALVAWVDGGIPQEPGAWLYRTACNHLVGVLRRDAGRLRILARAADELASPAEDARTAYFPHEVRDDLLRMLFVCCDEAIPRDSRLVLALKTLCGFSTSEIALRLFTSDANVHKRLQRARERLRDSSAEQLVSPPIEALASRLPSVHEVLYLLFNEGYLSSQPDLAIRRDLCEEAVRLTTLLAEHELGAVPETFALLALMHFHSARLSSRVDGDGALLLLEEQDRTQWDVARIGVATAWLARSATGEVLSRYHAEAGIAAEHCLSPSFSETRWPQIASLYEMLEQCAPSPLHTLNRAVAVAEWKGPTAALALLARMSPPTWLEESYLWHAVQSDLHRRAGQREGFYRHRVRALSAAPSDAVRVTLLRRLSDERGDR